MEAAIAATDQIFLAVLGCTATLVLAFLPRLCLAEGAGDFIGSLPVAILFTVAASLCVSLTIIPFLASRMLRDHSPRAAASAGTFARLIARFDVLGDRLLLRVMQIIHNVYGPALRRALATPKTTLLAALGLFAVVAATVPVIGFSLFPSADVPQFVIRVDAPDGASVEETDRAWRFVEARLAERPEIKRWYTHLGHGTPFVYYNYFSQGRTANLGEVFVELRAFDPKRTPKLFEALRSPFNEYAAARISLNQFQHGPPPPAPAALPLLGPDGRDCLST